MQIDKTELDKVYVYVIYDVEKKSYLVHGNRAVTKKDYPRGRIRLFDSAHAAKSSAPYDPEKHKVVQCSLDIESWV